MFELHAQPNAYEFGHAGFYTPGVNYLEKMLEVLQQLLELEERQQFLFPQMAPLQRQIPLNHLLPSISEDGPFGGFAQVFICLLEFLVQPYLWQRFQLLSGKVLVGHFLFMLREDRRGW